MSHSQSENSSPNERLAEMRSPGASDYSHNRATSRGSAGNRSDTGFTDQADEFWDNAVNTMSSAVAAANRTLQRNPTLAIAGVVAVGAVAALVMRNRSSSRSGFENVRRNLDRQARDLRRAVRDEMRAHNVESTFNRVASNLGNIDLKPYLQPILEPIVERAASLAQSAQKNVSQMTK